MVMLSDEVFVLVLVTHTFSAKTSVVVMRKYHDLFPCDFGMHGALG